MKFEAEPDMPLDQIKCRLDSYRGNLFKTNVSIFYPVVLIALNASGHHGVRSRIGIRRNGALQVTVWWGGRGRSEWRCMGTVGKILV